MTRHASNLFLYFCLGIFTLAAWVVLISGVWAVYGWAVSR